MQMHFKDIEDYGIIGNLQTCALVGKDGSIDWLCFPELGSASVFAALLDVEKGGYFRVSPVDKYESFQMYYGKSNILITYFKTAFGDLKLTDFMPVIERKNQKSERALFRKIESTEDNFKIEIKFAPRFRYAQDTSLLRHSKHGVAAESKNERLFLQSSFPLRICEAEAVGVFELRKGRPQWLILMYNGERYVKSAECEDKLVKTKNYWTGWERRHQPHKKIFQGPLYDIIVRSGLVLKLLTNPSTGSIAAAATTSLPEEIGGVRNWDYRFAWIRDASFTSQALFHLGHVKEVREFMSWIESIIRKKGPSDLRIMYGLHGQTELKEKILNNLSGYKNSAPVRIGNAAYRQRQLDIYGELINMIYDMSRYGRRVGKEMWQDIKNIVNYVCRQWRRKDSGIWEMRGEPKHFVYSKLMCWVAVDRAIKIAEQQKFSFPLDRWKRTKEEIRGAVLEKGFSRRLNTFVQAFDEEELDASSLLIPLMEFLPFDDSRVRGTIEAVRNKLTVRETFVRRYESEDALPGSEGAFLICTFWLIKALLLSGRLTEAKKYFSNILKCINPLGLFAEEIDPETGRQLGNFPQALSHIGLINCALYLVVAHGRRHRGPMLIGAGAQKKEVRHEA